MKLKSNKIISENTIREFVRVLIPKWEKSSVNAEFSLNKLSKKIILKLKVENLEKEFTFDNIEVIEDLKIILLKTSLLKLSGEVLPWGGLIGVRPTKVIKRLETLGFSYEEIENLLETLYLVSKEKRELLMNIYKKEQKIMNSSAYSIYIGIPFCPTKCRYCSFASFEIGSPVGERYYKGFVQTLLKEIELTGKLIKDKNFKIESIYIGGGTPSTLEEDDLEKVLKQIEKYIDKSNLREFTFEAGREDTITRKKLELCKEYGVDRVSLNPQTFNIETLKKINRNFNLDSFNKCYNWMKELGFIINMDLILGLPGEGESEILDTLEKIKEYNIENLTIHSLALKKSSTLYKDSDKEINALEREVVEKKIQEILKHLKMEPYYLYRQKNSVQWGENVGYGRIGFESVFNIEMIEENQSTIGLGGGAITKKIQIGNGHRDNVIRIINPKEPATYIREMEERFQEKEKLFGDLK